MCISQRTLKRWANNPTPDKRPPATIPNPDSFISSKPINITKAYIFSLTTYQSIQEFEGKRLAIRRGLSIGNIRKKI